MAWPWRSIGAGGPACATAGRTSGSCWPAIGGVLMLGRFTFLFDHAHQVPVLGSSRDPGAVPPLGLAGGRGAGGRRGRRLGGRARSGSGGGDPGRWSDRSPRSRSCSTSTPRSGPSRGAGPQPYHLARYRWLGRELRGRRSATRVLVVAGSSGCAWRAARSGSASAQAGSPGPSRCWSWSDLLASHARDVPTVSPDLLDLPPETARGSRPTRRSSGSSAIGDKLVRRAGLRLRADRFPVGPRRPGLEPARRSGAWPRQGRDADDPAAAARLLRHGIGEGRFDIEGVTHVVTGRDRRNALPAERAGRRGVHPSQPQRPAPGPAGGPAGLRRGRRRGASRHSRRLGAGGPRPAGRRGSRPGRSPEADRVRARPGSSTDLPERVEVETESAGPLTWSWPTRSIPAGRRPSTAARARSAPPTSPSAPSPCRRAAHGRLHLPPGRVPAGPGDQLVGACWHPSGGPSRGGPPSAADHTIRPTGSCVPLMLVILCAHSPVSVIQVGPARGVGLHRRWRNTVHRFTWAAGIEAMKENRR